MAFQARNLSVLAYANGFTLWHYTTVDPAESVAGAGYFDPAAEMLRAGDVILANVDTDAAIAARSYHVATANDGRVGIAATG